MGMRITTNVAALNAQRTMTTSQREIQKSMSQLSSGSRITKSADDAAGLAISENLKSQLRSYAQAGRNANDGISLIQTAEGGLGEISNIMTRMRELAIQSASDTVGDRERDFLNREVQQLKQESERIAKTTRFGATSLIDGSGESFDFQVGVYNNANEDRITFDPKLINATTNAMGIDGFDFSTKSGAQEALSVLDDAQKNINGHRSTLGALQNRMQSTVDNINVAYENLSAANSRIRDTDVAMASSEMARNNILLQSNTAVLAQANAIPNAALKLVG